MVKKVYNAIATRFAAYNNCIKNNSTEWEHKHHEALESIIKNHLPSGSGIDNGIELNYKKSTNEKLVFISSFHVMDENGFYDGWITFTLTVKPSLLYEIDLTISGNFSAYKEQGKAIKDMLYDTFRTALTKEILYDILLLY